MRESKKSDGGRGRARGWKPLDGGLERLMVSPRHTEWILHWDLQPSLNKQTAADDKGVRESRAET